ncbi:MAG: RNA 2',3'-cyclic phosphodiesterase [Acidimicrobiia bacterium]
MARTEDTIRRIFVAIDLDDEVRHALAAHLGASFGERPLPGSTPPPANWHITLRFLGKMDQVAYEVLLSKLDHADLGPAFPVSFGGFGAFPRPSKATVLWLGVENGSDALNDLAGTVEAAVVEAGFMPEERPFHPHLTLSRVRPPQDVRGLIESMATVPLKQVVDAVTVFESHLGGGPAVYEALERIRLD